MATGPTIKSITRHRGVAGSYAYGAVVQYDDEPQTWVTFTGSTYGGPIVMATESGTQVFVSESVLDRLGRTLDEAWVRAFFSDSDERR